ncbi:MAG: hypothetical protein LQ352_003071 [Teloschistes flavicans]|nr:MAG: hypothetical protein LQ352_003071 [Teloschistes flavicans]
MSKVKLGSSSHIRSRRKSRGPWVLSCLSTLLSHTAYNIRTIYLLTYSDILQFIFPTILFGFTASLSSCLLAPNPSQPAHVSWSTILYNTPRALLWIWSNTIICDLCNQRHPESIREDSVNKPYRPIPSGRLSAEQARRWTLYALPFTYALSSALGAARETPVMYIVLWMLDELGGREEHWAIRNVLNASGFVGCCVGIVPIFRGQVAEAKFNTIGWAWCGVICGAIASTLQVADLRDQEGDKAIGRKTMPLVLGDGVARWSIVGATVFWSFVCCQFWGVRWQVWILEISINALLIKKLLRERNARADAVTYRIWGAWLVSLYFLPLWYETRFGDWPFGLLI